MSQIHRRKDIVRKRRARVFAAILTLGVIIAALVLLLLYFLRGAGFGGGNEGSQTNGGNTSQSGGSSSGAGTTAAASRPTIAASAGVSAPRLIAYNITGGYTMLARDEREQCAPASLTKLLTAIVAAENCTADSEFVVGDELGYVEAEASKANFQKGYRLNYESMMDALLVSSASDAAYTIAAVVGRQLLGDPNAGTFDALIRFMDEMNDTAKKLGAVDSRFVNPDGMNASNHYSTAYDMLLISKKALEYESIRTAAGKTKAVHTLLSGQPVTFTSTNQLIYPAGQYYFQGTTGLKTGTLDESGYCLSASASRDGVEMLVIIMGCLTNEERFAQAKEVLTDCYAAIEN